MRAPSVWELRVGDACSCPCWLEVVHLVSSAAGVEKADTPFGSCVLALPAPVWVQLLDMLPVLKSKSSLPQLQLYL